MALQELSESACASMAGDGVTLSCSTPKPSASWIMHFFPDDLVEFPSPIHTNDVFAKEVCICNILR